jgi:hypothetical protein
MSNHDDKTGSSQYYDELVGEGFIPSSDPKPPSMTPAPGMTAANYTPLVAPFPYGGVNLKAASHRYAPIPTPVIMRARTLFGLPLRSYLTSEPLSDETIQFYINEAISELEHTLDIYITPVKFSERQDYEREKFIWSFGYFKTRHSPILTVTKFQLTFNNGQSQTPPLVDIPLEFVWVQPQEGTVQLVPAQGVTISGLIVSVYSGLGFHAFNNQAITNWPGAILVEYVAGFEPNKVPALLSSLIENIAARKLLSALGPVLFPYNSTSIGIDGVSQSVGTLGPGFLQNRLADLEKQIQEQMDVAKGYYQKRFLIDNL